MIKGQWLYGIILLSLPWLVFADASMSITGVVVASPCTVDSDTVNKTVDFGTLQRRDLRTAGDAGAWQDFNLVLTNCPTGTTTVQATLSGTGDTSDSTAWKNSGSSGNLALRITNGNHTIVYAPGASLLNNINTSSRSAIFPMSARIFTPQGSATVGTFRAVMNIEFTWQ